MQIALYEIAVQVVPVLMIALFLDRRTATRVGGRWARVQDYFYLVLCVGAFVVSLLIVAGVLEHGRVTEAIIIAALTGCVILMAVHAWPRFASTDSEGT